jgi:hypothetical protein
MKEGSTYLVGIALNTIPDLRLKYHCQHPSRSVNRFSYLQEIGCITIRQIHTLILSVPLYPI